MWRASPDRAQPGIHAEPLNVTIGKLLAPYCPGRPAIVINNGNTTNTIKKLLVSNQGTFLLVKVVIFMTQNGPPTQLIDAQCALQI